VRLRARTETARVGRHDYSAHTEEREEVEKRRIYHQNRDIALRQNRARQKISWER